MTLSDNFKKLRIKYQLTQQELAEIAGVTNKAISAWESGLSEPRMGAIERIASHLHIKKSNIIEEDGIEHISSDRRSK
ncbi:heme-binding protein [Paenibacillus jamilae]|uniref:helix-turn-helix transcriptional regulator n=1 Tax=Paenibacillus jamilae TaxID=114136 RepID=UPI0007AB2C98|nr:helix-turn-helix transcriptional regulator [Paenibacillus jamilae]KZE72606.1 heme-binding protein [Paenibacillus jamilae]